jgi:exosortase A
VLKTPSWNFSKAADLAPVEGAGAGARPLSGPTIPGSRLAHGVVIGLALVWLLFWYRDTALAMEAIWSRSGTFAHGYLVAPISLWLVWRKRAVLAGLPLGTSWLGAAFGLGCGLVWLVAQLASVDAVAQLALVGMVVATVWALAGGAVAWALAFPLGFLVFCVPFGEFLFPSMMDRTADFVVAALRGTGIPVYIEGRSLVIPSGHWQIVEGCSGVRYLIASIVVGCLYAYLNYRSLTRRLVFVALAVAAPILANWLRAYGIVLLGHVSGNRLATGVDHLIYGWVFFGIVMLGLFWIGARWQEPEESVAHEIQASLGHVRQQPAPAFRNWLVAAVLVMAGLSLASPAFLWLDSRGQQGPVDLAVPGAAGAWAPGDPASLPEWTPRYGGMAAQARSAWTKDGATVGVFLGYYRNQEPGRELTNSENKIIQSKDPVWTLASYGTYPLAQPEGSSSVLSTEIRGTPGRLLVWHWYWIGGRVTSNDYVAKVLLVLAKLAGRGDDSAVVMLHTPVADEDGRARAERVLADFVQEMGPSVSQALARAAGH